MTKNHTDTRMQTRRIRKERGVALVLTIFGLLLLTGIVVAMMFSSNSETMIACDVFRAFRLTGSPRPPAAAEFRNGCLERVSVATWTGTDSAWTWADGVAHAREQTDPVCDQSG